MRLIRGIEQTTLMKCTQALAYAMGAMFILGETARRGIDYFSINATTMLEDYGSGILLILAAAACTTLDLASHRTPVPWVHYVHDCP